MAATDSASTNNVQEEKKDDTATGKHVRALNDGHTIPMLGFGTYLLSTKANNKQKLSARQAVKYAISIGYRHIDTAIFYGNEAEIGKGIKDSGINRSELFITTKLWSEGHETGDGETADAVNASLKKLDCGYIDLYLIHSPYGGHNVATYKELLKFKQRGLLKSVGVSNYGVQHLKALEAAGCPLPVVNQIELHPWLQQKEIVKYCRSKNIAIESYSPLTKGKKLPDERKPFNQQSKQNKLLINMKKNYENKSIAQILLKWNIQTGHVVIAKSANKNRIEQNLEVLDDWTLTDSDFATLNGFDCDYHCTWNPTTEKVKGSDW